MKAKVTVKVRASAVALLLGLISSGALAGASIGVITGLMVHPIPAPDGTDPGLIMFTAGTHTAKPACSVVADGWAFSLKTHKARAMYALLLSAQAQGKPVHVIGSNDCADWGDRERPHYIYIED